MKKFKFSLKLFLPYILIVLGAAAIFSTRSFALTNWHFTLVMLYFVLVPGYLLNSVLNFKFIDKLGNLVLIIASGLTLNLFLAFIAIVLALNINILLVIYSLVFVVLFAGSILKNLKNPIKTNEQFKLKVYLKENWPYALFLLMPLLVLIAVDSQGASFRGDPYFHIVIMRKAIEGQALTPVNLSYIKSGAIHPAYGFPAWHVFLAMLTKFSGSNIFNAWFSSALPLTALTMAVWLYLYKLIFKHKIIYLTAFTLFLIFNFYYLDGYMFTRLPVPDTLAQLLLLPLTVALALKYVFDRTTNHFLLVLFSLLALLMGAIHMSQYVYFMLIMTVFVAVYAIGMIKTADYLPTLKRIVLAAFANLAVVLPFAGLLELKGNTVSKTIGAYWQTDPGQFKLSYRPFKGVEWLDKYAYIVTPILFYLGRKKRELSFIFALFLVMPLTHSVTIGFIRDFLLKTVGYITMNRLYANVTWADAVWGLALGFAIVGLVHLANKLIKNKWIILIAEIFVALALTLMIYAQYQNEAISKFFASTINSINVASYLNDTYAYFVLALVGLVAIALIWFNHLKWQLPEQLKIKSPLLAVLLALVVCFVFFSPNLKSASNVLKVEFTQKKNFVKSEDRTSEVIYMGNIGGESVSRFIKENIPPKSVFLMDKAVYQTLPLLNDVHSAFYPRTDEEKEYKRIYYDDYPIADKLKVLKKSGIDYIFMSVPSQQGEKSLNAYPQYFKLLHRSDIAIYEVNKAQVLKDAK